VVHERSRNQTKEINPGEPPGAPRFSSCLLQPKPFPANGKVGTSVLLHQGPLALRSELCTVLEWPQWNHLGLEKAPLENKFSRKQEYENELLPGKSEQFSEQAGNTGKIDNQKKYWVC